MLRACCQDCFASCCSNPEPAAEVFDIGGKKAMSPAMRRQFQHGAAGMASDYSSKRSLKSVIDVAIGKGLQHVNDSAEG